MVDVAITGAAGRMGKTLIEALTSVDDLTLTAAVEQPGMSLIGADAGEVAGIGSNGVKISDDLASVCGSFDVLIDFTIAPATVNNVQVCLAHEKKMVIGTTGLSDSERADIRTAAETIAIVQATNFSVGVNATFKLAEIAAAIMGDDVDVEITEAHHRHKVDAPSGTAATLGEVVADALGREINDVAVYGRQGFTGERDRKTIGFNSIRAGSIVGDHTVVFAGEGERIEITHRAESRMNFAVGALRAVSFADQQTTGLYDMQDVLNLRSIKA
jgi:4-hydroxy-tetrahydrodipicolinate reductase